MEGSGDQEKVFPRCERIDFIPQVIPGLGCCQCSAYNNHERKDCKNCGHVPCYQPVLPTSERDSR
jgi:hypothetical protein